MNVRAVRMLLLSAAASVQLLAHTTSAVATCPVYVQSQTSSTLTNPITKIVSTSSGSDDSGSGASTSSSSGSGGVFTDAGSQGTNNADVGSSSGSTTSTTAGSSSGTPSTTTGSADSTGSAGMPSTTTTTTTTPSTTTKTPSATTATSVTTGSTTTGTTTTAGATTTTTAPSTATTDTTATTATTTSSGSSGTAAGTTTTLSLGARRLQTTTTGSTTGTTGTTTGTTGTTTGTTGTTTTAGSTSSTTTTAGSNSSTGTVTSTNSSSSSSSDVLTCDSTFYSAWDTLGLKCGGSGINVDSAVSASSCVIYSGSVGTTSGSSCVSICSFPACTNNAWVYGGDNGISSSVYNGLSIESFLTSDVVAALKARSSSVSTFLSNSTMSSSEQCTYSSESSFSSCSCSAMLVDSSSSGSVSDYAKKQQREQDEADGIITKDNTTTTGSVVAATSKSVAGVTVAITGIAAIASTAVGGVSSAGASLAAAGSTMAITTIEICQFGVLVNQLQLDGLMMPREEYLAKFFDKMIGLEILVAILSQYTIGVTGTYQIYYSVHYESFTDAKCLLAVAALIFLAAGILIYGYVVVKKHEAEIADVGTVQHMKKTVNMRYGPLYEEYKYKNRFFFAAKMMLALTTGVVTGFASLSSTVQVSIILAVNVFFFFYLEIQSPHHSKFVQTTTSFVSIMKIAVLVLTFFLISAAASDGFPTSLQNGISVAIVGLNLFVLALLMVRSLYTFWQKFKLQRDAAYDQEEQTAQDYFKDETPAVRKDANVPNAQQPAGQPILQSQYSSNPYVQGNGAVDYSNADEIRLRSATHENDDRQQTYDASRRSAANHYIADERATYGQRRNDVVEL
ncbi:hypothetical protein BBO99_00008756 [Phytophthora kernoviae]|uniref:TRP C-terminal domain-containing protein n=1 Tax=Phytophthora kernoviae TaxID=325452 RepID=A0A3R7J323_9STRA|nr:hypothetical protein BBI17_008779 [Phytophthora kernoviae]RLN74762.1 hypothetical protein BBO99_00008756 [Phytophthora kernoviae]